MTETDEMLALNMALQALLAALPRCEDCNKPATRIGSDGSERDAVCLCDSCRPELRLWEVETPLKTTIDGMAEPEVRWAPALRQLRQLLEQQPPAATSRLAEAVDTVAAAARKLRTSLPNGANRLAPGDDDGVSRAVAGTPIGTVVVQVQAVDSLGADLTPAAIRTGWGCRCGELYEITGEVITGDKQPCLPTPSGNLSVAVETIIAAEQAWQEMPAGVELTPIGQAVQEGLVRLRCFDGWQIKLRDTVSRLHRIGRPPDELLGAWEHETRPLNADSFEELRRDLEEAVEPFTEGHRRTLVAARRLWDEAKRKREREETTS